MPIYAKDIYGGGPHTLGLLLSAAGAGALASTTYLAGRDTIRGLGRVIALAAATAGSRSPRSRTCACSPLALVLMPLVGGGVILAAASTNTILQTIVDDRLRGRVAGFYTMAFLGVAPVGNLAAGALAAALRRACDVRAQRPRLRRRGAGSGGGCRRWPPLMRPTYKRLGIVVRRVTDRARHRRPGSTGTRCAAPRFALARPAVLG